MHDAVLGTALKTTTQFGTKLNTTLRYSAQFGTKLGPAPKK